MSRTVNYSLDYFPFDVDFFSDPKVIMIEDQFKAKGLAITTVLLCMIYRNGYFLSYTEEMPYIIAKCVGCEVDGELVKEVVKYMVKVKFFDQAVLEKCQILTSRGIQKRWTKIITDCKRKAIIPPLHRITSEETGISSEETPINSEVIPQRKGKERKGEEKKEKEKKGDDEEGPSSPSFLKSEISGPYLPKNSLSDFAESLEKDQLWIEVSGKSLSKSREEILTLIPEFVTHCQMNKRDHESVQDFAGHFINWARKQKYQVTGGKRSSAGFPDHWDSNLEKKLQGAELSAYWAHLRSQGLRPKKNRFQVTVDWVPEDQLKAS